MTTEEVIQMRIRNIQREIDDLERTKAVMVGKSMWIEKPKRKTPRKIAIWHGDRILVTGTAEQLSEITGLSKNTIWDRASSLWIDSKGRQFRYVEEKKC